MRGVPGTSCVMTVAWWNEGAPVPEPGDFLRTRTGSCYRIDEVRPGRVRPVSSFRCTRLEKDAVAEGAPGVWMWEWKARARRGIG